MARKKYEYKYLTDEMKKIIDEEIEKIGRNELYEKVEHNIEVQRVASLQNEEGAFEVIRNGPWKTTQWEDKYFLNPLIVDMDNLGQEILHYIDKKDSFKYRIFIIHKKRKRRAICSPFCICCATEFSKWCQVPHIGIF